MARERDVAQDELERERVLGLDHLAPRLGLGLALLGDRVGERHHRLGLLERGDGAVASAAISAGAPLGLGRDDLRRLLALGLGGRLDGR